MAGIGWGGEDGILALISFTPVTRAGWGSLTSGEELELPGLLLSLGVISLTLSPCLYTAVTGDTDTHISVTREQGIEMILLITTLQTLHHDHIMHLITHYTNTHDHPSH